MKKILLSTFTLISAFSFGQVCSMPVYPHVPDPNGGSYHILSDTTIYDQNGSNYYVCSGVTLTMDYSAGCNYQLEAGATLIIMDHAGDNVLAKENCSITDYSTEGIAVSMESTSTFSKPNAPWAGVVFTCSDVTYDYSPIGGSSPCGGSLDVAEVASPNIALFPNPTRALSTVNFSHPVASFSMIDNCGRVVLTKSELSEQFSISGLPKGIYLVKGSALDGSVFTERLVIQ